MSLSEPRVLIDNLRYPEAPRWHNGRLYVSDFFGHEVVSSDLAGYRETRLRLPGEQPGGLGWLPDGRMLIASMRDARLLVADGDDVVELADLRAHAAVLNDMIVSASGRAYIGELPDVYIDEGADEVVDGFNAGGEPSGTQALFAVDLTPDNWGRVSVVASGLRLPNAMAITPDGRTLILAETLESRLLAFDIHEDGSLHAQRTWAQLPGMPDGICLDAEGQVWVAMPLPARSGFVRVAEGGEITERIDTESAAVACTLGGEAGDHLFLVEIDVIGTGSARALRTPGNGRVRVCQVDVPGAGLP